MGWKEDFARGMDLVNRGWLVEVKDGKEVRPKHGQKHKYSGAAIRELNRTRGSGRPVRGGSGQATAVAQDALSVLDVREEK